MKQPTLSWKGTEIRESRPGILYLASADFLRCILARKRTGRREGNKETSLAYMRRMKINLITQELL